MEDLDGRPHARSPAAICIVQLGFALATTLAPVDAMASAFDRISASAVWGCVTTDRPAAPQHVSPSGTSTTSKPGIRSRSARG